MTYFVYTDSKTFNGSSVLENAYYNSETGHLAVALLSGVVAGYEGVPEGLWKNFVREDTLNGSPGRFWNRMIKDTFGGVDTSEIEDFIDKSTETSDRISYGYTDQDYFNPTPAVPHIEISEAAPDEAPELDEVSPPRPEDFPEGSPSRASFEFVQKDSPEVVDVRAGSDIGQRRYEIIVERTVTREEVKVIYANSEDEALAHYNDTFGNSPADETDRIVGITRRF